MKRNSSGEFQFEDFPNFTPNISPREMFEQGCFGGTYWKPIHSSILGTKLSKQHLEFKEFFEGIDEQMLSNSVFVRKVNKYQVKSGTSQEFWESKDWIHPLDPYGWVQWYCRFFSGRRCEDDERQIKRWCNFAGLKGRFRRQLITKIINKNTTYDDYSVSPVIRQGLHQWAYCLTENDFENEKFRRWDIHSKM
tara:strand:+ start:106 stop:684 length:579 start_codon:yes stop_codon:yes gene_type:complete